MGAMGSLYTGDLPCGGLEEEGHRWRPSASRPAGTWCGMVAISHMAQILFFLHPLLRSSLSALRNLRVYDIYHIFGPPTCSSTLSIATTVIGQLRCPVDTRHLYHVLP